MDDTRRYDLRLSLFWRAVFIAAGVLCFTMVADALDTGDPFAILTSLAFFGFGGIVMLKVMLRNSGSIELRQDGLLIDSYLTTGFIPWQDFESAQSLRLLGVSYLGLTTRDLPGYIDSRKQLTGLKHEGDRVLAGGFTRIMLSLLQVLPPAKSGINFVISLFGYAPLPKQFDEPSLLAWSQQSYGSQLLIHRMWLPEFESLLRELQQRAGTTPPTQQVAGTNGAAGVHRRIDPAVGPSPDSRLKPCPMCAERVQPEARICRFCRYSFDEERLLPTSSQ